MGKFDNYINVTAPLHSATIKGKLGNANEIFLEGDNQNIENEINEINSRHEELNKKHDTLSSKHESLSRTVQGIAATGGASTANNVTYNNDTSGLNAENTQDAIDELQNSKINKTSILQESGEAEDKVMSQKAVSTKLKELSDTVNYIDNITDLGIADGRNNILLLLKNGGLRTKNVKLSKEGVFLFDNNGKTVFDLNDLLSDIKSLLENTQFLETNVNAIGINTKATTTNNIELSDGEYNLAIIDENGIKTKNFDSTNINPSSLNLLGGIWIDKDDLKAIRLYDKTYWNDVSYNKKYGWVYPEKNDVEKFPYISSVLGVLECDMYSVRGGYGRWNKEGTNNFKHGGHLFEGWNKEEDARLTFGIGLHNPYIAWIQTFRPTKDQTLESSQNFYGITKIGSDLDKEGVDFMPDIALAKSVICCNPSKTEPRVSKKNLSMLSSPDDNVGNVEIDNSLVNDEDSMIIGSMYYNTDKKAVMVYTENGWRELEFSSKISLFLDGGVTKPSSNNLNINHELGSKVLDVNTSLDVILQLNDNSYPKSVCVQFGYATPASKKYRYSYNNQTGALSINKKYVYQDINICRGSEIKINNTANINDIGLQANIDVFGIGKVKYGEKTDIIFSIKDTLKTLNTIKVVSEDGNLSKELDETEFTYSIQEQKVTVSLIAKDVVNIVITLKDRQL